MRQGRARASRRSANALSSACAVQKRSKKKRYVDVAKPIERPRMPLGVLLRMFVLGSVAVGASGYAIYRHYFVPRPSMLAPAPSASEVPAPEVVPVE
jgi:hypothetical protein